jgi:hypothetical protein
VAEHNIAISASHSDPKDLGGFIQQPSIVHNCYIGMTRVMVACRSTASCRSWSAASAASTPVNARHLLPGQHPGDRHLRGTNADGSTTLTSLTLGVTFARATSSSPLALLGACCPSGPRKITGPPGSKSSRASPVTIVAYSRFIAGTIFLVLFLTNP